MQYDLNRRAALVGLLSAALIQTPVALALPSDPGVRHAATDNATPQPLAGIGADEMNFFLDGMARFNFIEVVSGGNSQQGTGDGLGPRFNSNQCASCHTQPNVVAAIQAHESQGSEANGVIQRFNNLSAQHQQDILNFLRSL
jgi:Di-haem oxidoreductase, putative peroxidase